jgi:conjugal transfer/entry exclusion protein
MKTDLMKRHELQQLATQLTKIDIILDKEYQKLFYKKSKYIESVQYRSKTFKSTKRFF